jgi:membrane protease YdiL (CAAX protease family)
LQTTSSQPPIPRSLQFALFLLGGIWVIASHRIADAATQGIITRLNLPAIEPLVAQLFFLFLLLVGFTAIARLVSRNGSFRSANSLPARETSGQEWQRGVALGWALALLSIIPMMVAGSLHPQFWLEPRSWGLAIVSIVTIAIGTLAVEVAYRGYIFRRLIDAVGPVAATIFLSLVYAIASTFRPNSTTLGVAVSFFAGVLYSVAYFRTNGLWLAWGLHFAWSLTFGVLLGLPIGGYANFSNLISTTVSGPEWLTGGAYGPDGAVITLTVLILALIPLYRITRDYAWNYTHPPIVSKGYAMEVAPPAAHTAMENAAAAAPAPLVQILSTTSTSSSTLPAVEEHLRTTNDAGTEHH